MREVSGSWSFLASLGSRGVSEPNYVEWRKGEGKGGRAGARSPRGVGE